jgi:two-component system cell cycle sensor histidine kinase/response regulator CckA
LRALSVAKFLLPVKLKGMATGALDSANRTHRLEQVGDFTASIAHDFNGILQIFVMGVPLLRARIDPMDERVLDQMDSAAKRGSEMIGQLLAFVRGSNGVTFKRITAEYLLSEIGALIRTTFPASIRLDSLVVPGTVEVHCDATQILQVLDNLVRNARDAMPKGGTITLRAQNIARAASMTGPCVEFVVADTGVGIPDDALAHMWEPFWTSKPRNHGTGLGLPTVRRIIDAHHGAITVKSSRAGSTFSFCLPVEVVPSSPTKLEVPVTSSGQTILLVDDDVGLRELTQILLEESGYRVLGANNGLEALAQFRAGSTIDLLLSDLSMPIMDGEMLVKALRTHGFKAPTIFLSGYSSPTPSGVDPFVILRKPVTRETLLAKIKEALNLK